MYKILYTWTHLLILFKMCISRDKMNKVTKLEYNNSARKNNAQKAKRWRICLLAVGGSDNII